MSAHLSRYWVSWYERGGERNLAPPDGHGSQILGCWTAGDRRTDEYDNEKKSKYDQRLTEHLIYTLLTAESDEHARSAIIERWPGAGEIRFVYRVSDQWMPPARYRAAQSPKKPTRKPKGRAA